MDQFIEHIARTHAGQLVRVAHKNDPRVLTNAFEELLCQPHIHHRELVHNDEVCIYETDTFLSYCFFSCSKSQRTMQCAGFVCAGAFRHTAAGATCGSHKGELSFRVQVLEHLDDGL